MESADISITRSSYFMSFLRVSPQEEILIFQAMKCYINPIFSILGLVANGFSIAILYRSGLHKPSNILLLGLAVSDSMCMLMTVDIPYVLTYFDPQKKYVYLNGWQYDYFTAYFLFLLHSACTHVGYWGCYANTFIPVLITVERFFAIFWPLTFKKFVSVKSAAICVVLVFAFWLPVCTFYQAMFPFSYFNVSGKVSMGVWSTSEYFNENFDTLLLVYSYIFDILSSWFPVSMVSIGCVSIWIQVKATISKRRALTALRSGGKWSPRTTRTLLASCLIFAMTHILYSIVVYVFNLDFVNFDDHFIEYELIFFIYLVNNSSNFFIYVAFNRNLWLIFCELISSICRKVHFC